MNDKVNDIFVQIKDRVSDLEWDEETMYFDEPKVYYIDFENVIIIDITDTLLL
mgnify:CR=1 FL=1